MGELFIIFVKNIQNIQLFILLHWTMILVINWKKRVLFLIICSYAKEKGRDWWSKVNTLNYFSECFLISCWKSKLASIYILIISLICHFYNCQVYKRYQNREFSLSIWKLKKWKKLEKKIGCLLFDWREFTIRKICI